MDWNYSKPAVLAQSGKVRGYRGPALSHKTGVCRMKRVFVVAGALLLSVGVGVAQQDAVKNAQDTMKGNGKNLGGVLSPMFKGDKPYDQAAVDAALTQLDDTANKLATLFPASIKDAKWEGDF